ncbi:hypothetical protein AVEN_19154-1 [Araneus ventricosus]|uniref:Uncharacterized protein n=1 Tax=Araneus ventricosus TaxID=182803 RepID=A0A4Y2PUI9_ARAVE|nr:hypothetical protein AVEN_19154-1 [Araneus ventricosus]
MRALENPLLKAGFRIKNEMFSLVIFMLFVAATRGLFWNGPRYFEPWSDDEDDTLSKFPRHTSWRAFRLDGFDGHKTRLHSGSSMESDVKPGTQVLECNQTICNQRE